MKNSDDNFIIFSQAREGYRLYYIVYISYSHIIGNVFQEEKLDVLSILNKIASLQDGPSDDREQYLKMGLRLDPNDPDMNFRNEKMQFFCIHRKRNASKNFLSKHSFHQSKLWRLVGR